MTTEKFTFTGADDKRHSMKRLMDLPARDAEAIFEALPLVMEAADGQEADQDAMKILPVIKIADSAMRAAFTGTDKAYDKAVNGFTIEKKFELFGQWLKNHDNPQKKD